MNATPRPVQTRFRCGSGCSCLNLATPINSPAHSPKGTRSRLSFHRNSLALPLSVSERFQVLFHSPHRGSFHLSLTVLVRYRSSRVFSLGRWSSLLPTGLACPVVLRLSGPRLPAFVYGTFTLSGWPFQCHSTGLLNAFCRGLQPHSPQGVVWAVPLSLATTRGIVSLPRGTEMFQFPRLPPASLCVQLAVSALLADGFPHSDIAGSLPAHDSPTLFAVYHVLLRLLTPRHPPFAFSRLFSCGDLMTQSVSLSRLVRLLVSFFDTSIDALFPYSVVNVLMAYGLWLMAYSLWLSLPYAICYPPYAICYSPNGPG